VKNVFRGPRLQGKASDLKARKSNFNIKDCPKGERNRETAKTSELTNPGHCLPEEVKGGGGDSWHGGVNTHFSVRSRGVPTGTLWGG